MRPTDGIDPTSLMTHSIGRVSAVGSKFAADFLWRCISVVIEVGSVWEREILAVEGWGAVAG